jgi:DNA-binding SARP family transcriptional activator
MAGGASQRRSLGLLAVLAGHQQGGVSREKLAALLWPESDRDGARNSLKQAVYILRHELGADLILGSAELRLNPDTVSCDRVAFEKKLAQGELEAAVAAYTGPFLDGFHLGGDSEEFERWADEERAGLARQYWDALEALAADATSRGDHAAALRWWRRLATIDPLDGRRARGIVASLLALGDRPSALRHAETYRALLAAELGLSPDAELEQLIASIRAAPPVVPRAVDPALFAAESEAPLRAPLPDPAGAPRARRWPDWIGLAATLAIVAAGAAVWWGITHRKLPIDPQRVAIIAYAPGGTAAATVSRNQRVVEAIARRLTAAAVTAPLVLAPAADARDAARRAGAGVVVTVAGSGDRGDVIEAALTDVTTGLQLWGARTLPLTPGPAGATDSLAERIAAAVATRLDPKLTQWINHASEPTSLESYQEFRRGLDLYADLQPGAAAPHFLAAARDTGFTMAMVMAAWANYDAGQRGTADSIGQVLQPRRLPPLDRAMVDHQVLAFKSDLAAEYSAAAVVATVAPQSEWRYLLAESALKVGRGREAIRVLEQIGPELGWLGSYSGYWMLLGRALHFAGEHERELATMEEARRRFPTNRIIAQNVLKALAALGRVAEVEAEVNRAVTLKQKGRWTDNQPMEQAVAELSAHGHPDAAKRLAERTIAWIGQQPPDDRHALATTLPYFLSEAGQRRQALRLATALAAEDPEDLELLLFVARASAEQGDRATARRIDGQLAAMSDPRLRSEFLMLRAGIAASLGDREAAVSLIQDACRAGFSSRNVLHILREFAPLRGYPPFEALAGPVD